MLDDCPVLTLCSAAIDLEQNVQSFFRQLHTILSMSRDIGGSAIIRSHVSIPMYTNVFSVGIIISSRRLSHFRLGSHSRTHRHFHSANLPLQLQPASYSIQIRIRSWNGTMYRDRCILCRHFNLISTALPLWNTRMHRRFLSVNLPLQQQKPSNCIQIRMMTPSGWGPVTAPRVLWTADFYLIIKRWGGYEGQFHRRIPKMKQWYWGMKQW